MAQEKSVATPQNISALPASAASAAPPIRHIPQSRVDTRIRRMPMNGLDDRRTAPPREYMRLRESVRMLEKDTGGRVLQAETFNRGGRELHRVKVLTPEGRIRVVQQPSQRIQQPEVVIHPTETPR